MSSRIVCAFAMAAATLQTASATKGVVTLDDLTFGARLATRTGCRYFLLFAKFTSLHLSRESLI